MDKTEIALATTEQLAKRLIEIRREEQNIMMALWNRAPKATRIPEKQLVKELKPNENKKR